MIRLLFQSLVGALFFALIGAGCLLIAIVGTTSEMSRGVESAPTPLALADFEKDGKMPADKRWLECTDGVLLWSGSKELVVTRTDDKGKKVGDDTVKTVFVPLVSKKAYDAGKDARDDLKQPINVARVYVRFNPTGFANQVLAPQGDPDVRPTLSGMVYTLDKDEQLVRDGLAPKGSLKDPAKVLIVKYNETAPTTGVIICVGVCLGVTGLLCFLPMVFWVVRKMRTTGNASVK